MQSSEMFEIALFDFMVFYLAALKGSGVLWSPEGAGGRQGRQTLLTLSRAQFFTDHFQTWQGHLLPYDLGLIRLRRFCFITHAHNGPFNEPAFFWHFWTHFQAKFTKFGINVGLHMLINISSGFYRNRQENIWRILFAFSNFAHWKSPLTLSRP